VVATGSLAPASYRLSQTILVWGYAAWLTSYPVLQFLLPNNPLVGGLALIIGVGMASFHLVGRPGEFRFYDEALLFIAAFGFMFFASQLIGNFENLDPTALLNCIAMIIVMFLSALIANSSVLRQVLATYSVLVAGFLVIVYLDGDYVWGRLVGRGQPNYWGMVALSVACSAFAIRRFSVRIGVWAIVALILFATNARGSLVATALAIGIGSWFAFRMGSWRLRYKLLTAAIVVAVVFVWAEIETGFVSRQLLRVDDPYRGFESYGNRLEPWIFGLSLWAERPFFGYGYRESDSLFGPIGLAQGGAHNGYITMLVDLGVFGLLLYLLFIGRALSGVMKGLHSPEGLAALVMLIGYATIGWFERYALNAGQSTSVVFLIAAFYALSVGNRVRTRAAMPARVGLAR
jgi:O-antigen ligase